MKTDITDAVQRYRLALRYIWNSCIWVDESLRDWESVDSFRKLKQPLFNTLVAEPLGLETGELFGSGFELVPDTACGAGIPAIQYNLWNPSSSSAGVWRVLDGPFTDEDLKITLVDLFDWSPMGYIDLRYYVALIEECPKHPEIVGHHALVDVTFARVLWQPKDEQIQ